MFNFLHESSKTCGKTLKMIKCILFMHNKTSNFSSFIQNTSLTVTFPPLYLVSYYTTDETISILHFKSKMVASPPLKFENFHFLSGFPLNQYMSKSILLHLFMANSLMAILFEITPDCLFFFFYSFREIILPLERTTYNTSLHSFCPWIEKCFSWAIEIPGVEK